VAFSRHALNDVDLLGCDRNAPAFFAATPVATICIELAFNVAYAASHLYEPSSARTRNSNEIVSWLPLNSNAASRVAAGALSGCMKSMYGRLVISSTDHPNILEHAGLTLMTWTLESATASISLLNSKKSLDYRLMILICARPLLVSSQ
jgi:hypothetical protein